MSTPPNPDLNPNPEPNLNPNPSPEFKAPEAYQNEAWAKEIKSSDDLWSRTAGLYKKLGANPLVRPGANASEAEITEFRRALGMPETHEGYTFQNIEELKDMERNQETDTMLKKMLHKHGIAKEVGEALVRDYESMVHEKLKPQIAAQAEATKLAQKKEQEFLQLQDTVLGADKDATVEAFKSTMREALGDKAYLVDGINDLDNKALLTVMTYAKAIHDTYGKESKVPNAPGSNSNGITGDLNSDFKTLSTRKFNIMADPNMPKHLKDQKVQEITKQMVGIAQKAADQGIKINV